MADAQADRRFRLSPLPVRRADVVDRDSPVLAGALDLIEVHVELIGQLSGRLGCVFAVSLALLTALAQLFRRLLGGGAKLLGDCLCSFLGYHCRALAVLRGVSLLGPGGPGPRRLSRSRERR